ncbi:MAG TPA: hypothetical protein VFQ26_09020 [Nitrospiraceae bacterium]|nr:hypothetical protein [Nitrospiraceae bacterium]
MSDVSPYGVTQNPDAAMVTANQLVGEHAGNVTAHQADERFSPARFSTAPYEVTRRGKCIGKDNTCEAYPIRGMDHCVFHRDQKERRELAGT